MLKKQQRADVCALSSYSELTLYNTLNNFGNTAGS